jgi:hypothetical protein
VHSTALPGAEAGVAAAIEAADLAQAAGAHETAAAFLATAADLAGPDDEQLTTIRARLGLALAWALRFDEAVAAARAAAERIAQGEGPHAAVGYLAEVTSALSAAGSSAHAWMLAPAGLAYAGPARDEAWAALTLLALDCHRPRRGNRPPQTAPRASVRHYRHGAVPRQCRCAIRIDLPCSCRVQPREP